MACQDQCDVNHLFFSGVDPNRFAYPQTHWPCLPGSFILYRILYASYQVSVFTLILLVWGEPPYYNLFDSKAKWFIFYFNWAYLLTVLYALWTALTTIYWHVRGEKRNNPGFFYYVKENGVTGEGGPPINTSLSTVRRSFTAYMPWYFKCTWFLQVLACSSEFAVTVICWVFVVFGNLRDDVKINFFTLNVHGISLVLITIDFLISANPYRVLHLVYIGLLGILYYLFTYIYHMLGGLDSSGNTYIYLHLLDWKDDPFITALVGIIVVVIICPYFHIVYFLLHRMKMAFAKCCDCCSFRNPGSEVTMS